MCNLCAQRRLERLTIAIACGVERDKQIAAYLILDVYEQVRRADTAQVLQQDQSGKKFVESLHCHIRLTSMFFDPNAKPKQFSLVANSCDASVSTGRSVKSFNKTYLINTLLSIIMYKKRINRLARSQSRMIAKNERAP